MKKLGMGCLAVLFLLVALALPALARQTTVTAEIEAAYVVEVQVSGGSVTAAGRELRGNGRLTVERMRRLEYRFLADSGKKLQTAWYDGAEITGEIQDGRWTAPALLKDAVLRVEFRPDGTAGPLPGTGDCRPAAFVILPAALGGAVLLLRLRRKQAGKNR